MNSSESALLKQKDDYQPNLSHLWHPMPAPKILPEQSALEVNNSEAQQTKSNITTAKIIVGYQHHQSQERRCCRIQ